MSEKAADAVMLAAAPGQFAAVGENLQKFGQISATQAQNEFMESRNEQDGSDHPIKDALKEKLGEYQKEYFLSKSGVTARVVLAKGKSSSQILVKTYAEKIDVPNQHSGKWEAAWTIESIDKGSAEISGRVIVHSYTHEEGNVQLKINKEFPPVVVGGGKSSIAIDIVEQIMKYEIVMLGILASLNDDVSSDYLRSIRRVLPITKTKMNWDAVAHRSVKTLKKTAPDSRSKVKYNN